MMRISLFGGVVLSLFLFLATNDSAAPHKVGRDAKAAEASVDLVVAHSAHDALSQILESKARGIYDANVWDAYFGADRRQERSRLDQGGDNIATAFVIPAIPFNDVGSTTGMNNDYYEDCSLPGPNLAPDVVYSYTPIENLTVHVSLCQNTPFDARLYVYEDAYAPGAPYACSDDDCNIIEPELLFLTLTLSHTYYFVVDGWGADMGPYLFVIEPEPPVVECPCPFPEQEPNDNFLAPQIIHLGEHFCGAISAPNDTDHVRLELSSETAIRITLFGNNTVGTCPEGNGLHPCVAVIYEAGDDIAFAGDTTNQATYFSSDFMLGAQTYVLKIVGANGTIGPYEMQVDPIELPMAAPPAPLVTIQTDADGDTILLRWQASYFVGEYVRIDAATTPGGSYGTVAVIPAVIGAWPVPVSTELRFFKVAAIGSRRQDPFVGSIISLSEFLDEIGNDQETGDFLIQEIEWGVIDETNEVAIARLRAQGVGAYSDEFIDQDNREMFGNGLSPIESFSGHKMFIYGRQVMVDHVAFMRDDEHGDIGVVDGHGTNTDGDTIMFFGDSPRYLTPDVGVSEAWAGWFGGWFIDPCGEKCCRLKVIAFCRSAFPWNPACGFGACQTNPSCWLGCPCPPPASPACSTTPWCSACELRTDTGFLLRRWCICPQQAAPPRGGFCMFQPWIKCKSYDCPNFPVQCQCAANPCPGPATWTLVPFVNSAMHAACRRFCT